MNNLLKPSCEIPNRLQATVMVVDDDPAIRESVAVVLRPLNVPVETYRSAEAFLESLCLSRPGCILLDVRMDGMSGLELQRKLAADYDYMSVIVVTGHATVAMSVSAMKHGAVDFLEKPYLPNELRDAVRHGLVRSDSLWRRHLAYLTYTALKCELSPRELDVYELLVAAQDNKQIARAFGISPSTVEKHRLSVLRKMRVENLMQLMKQQSGAKKN